MSAWSFVSWMEGGRERVPRQWPAQVQVVVEAVAAAAVGVGLGVEHDVRSCWG